MEWVSQSYSRSQVELSHDQLQTAATAVQVFKPEAVPQGVPVATLGIFLRIKLLELVGNIILESG
jgi:hypothetical protein